jgi:hypothetical protein
MDATARHGAEADRSEEEIRRGYMKRIAIAVCAVVLVFAVAIIAQPYAKQTKKRVERADQLPAHSYPITGKVSAILTDDAAALQLMNALEADLKKDLQEYEIQDKATLKLYYYTLADFSFLRGQYDDAVKYLNRGCQLEDKPAQVLMSGIFLPPLISAKKAQPKAFLSTFKAEFDKAVTALPFDVVQAELKALKGGLETLSQNLFVGLVEQQYDPAGKSGSISKDFAMQVLNYRSNLLEIMPVKDAMTESLARLIAAHKVDKADIWGEREVTLSAAENLAPVVVGIWDTGIDVSLFPGCTFVNPNEKPGNNIDDDDNGYVDDVYGIGWTWNNEKSVGPLRAVAATKEQMEQYKHFNKGSLDLEAAIDSPEAAEFKKRMASLSKEEVKPFLEGLTLYGLYSHGTHVAGIAARRNPAIRLLVVRMDFPYEFISPVYTLDRANKEAIVMRETISYFRSHGVRVVNMSWGGTPQGYEGNLEVNNAGGTPAERKALARRIFDIISNSLRSAMADASKILFICSAGNSDSDVRFNEAMPSSYDLPNVMSIGAVDKAGDEAAFTSYGKVDLYANGYEVESVVPGGDKQKWSGTSMASPQAVNLAAKLLAAYPKLTTAQLRALIIDGCDSKAITDNRKILLLNEKKSFELAQKRYSAGK